MMPQSLKPWFAFACVGVSVLACPANAAEAATSDDAADGNDNDDNDVEPDDAPSFPTFARAIEDICKRGQPAAKFKRIAPGKWTCSRCPLGTDFAGMTASGVAIKLAAAGHFSSRVAREQIVQVEECESYAGGRHRTYLLRGHKHRVVRVTSLRGSTIDYPKALRVRATDGRELLVGTSYSFINSYSFFHGVGRTEVMVISVDGDYLTEETLLTVVDDVKDLRAPGSPCHDHSVDRVSVGDTYVDGTKAIVVTTSERTGFMKRSGPGLDGAGKKEIECVLNGRKLHKFRFLFDGVTFRPNRATRAWIDKQEAQP